MEPKFSLRTRLTLHFAVLFGGIVVSLAVAAYALARHDAYAKLDSQLQVAVDATAMSAGHELTEHLDRTAGESDLQTVLLESPEAALPGTQILVTEQGRQVAYRGSKQKLPDLRRLSLDKATPFTVDGLRIASREFVVPRFAPYRIYSAVSLAELDARLSRVKLWLLICVPLGLAMASLAGYLLARRDLAGLLRLAGTIDSIKPSDLSARVPIPACEDEIGRLALRFNSLLERLDGAFAVQRRFMADASHELRTPVSIALSAAQVTARDPRRTVADCDQTLALVENQMLRLKRIVSDMLLLSHADGSSLRLESKEMCFDDAIADACEGARVLARAKQQSLYVKNMPEAPCSGDYELLKQALLILLENAVKFMAPGGTIEVTLAPRSGMWACRISDSGPGIPSEAQPFIFQRFYRADPPPGSKISGSGLGLAIAKAIVDRHNGQISLVESQPGRTVFEIAIPASKEQPVPVEVQANSFAVRM